MGRARAVRARAPRRGAGHQQAARAPAVGALARHGAAARADAARPAAHVVPALRARAPALLGPVPRFSLENGRVQYGHTSHLTVMLCILVIFSSQAGGAAMVRVHSVRGNADAARVADAVWRPAGNNNYNNTQH